MMNRFIITALSVFCLLASACKKDKQAKEPDNLYLTATKDNTNWITNWHTYADVDAAKNYVLVGINKEENINIRLTVNSSNQYVLVEDKTVFYITVGQDAIVARYTPDNSAGNTVNVTNHDIKNALIEGNFNIKFKKISGADTYPATVNFTDGKFRMSKAYD